MDRRTDADVALRQLEYKFADVTAYDIGAVHAYRGEADAAVKVDPLFRNLHSDPRYKVLLRKINLPD
jgi:hypothetical protein